MTKFPVSRRLLPIAGQLRWFGAFTLLLLAAGCGRDDPFDRVAATGTVTIDGRPVPYAQLFIESIPEKGSQSAKSTIRAVNGIFDVSTSYGPASGENSVSIALYTTAPVPSSDPDQEDTEGELIGTWTGTVRIESGKPLDFSFDSKQIQK